MMDKHNLISASEFCTSHDVDISFLQSLGETGLINIIVEDENMFLPADRLSDIEKIIHLHFELEINMEGIETILYLLRKSEELHKEISELKNRLSFYEQF